VGAEQVVGHVLLEPLHAYPPHAETAVPAPSGAHVPDEHVPHDPHAPPQQYPSAEQIVDEHWLPFVHALPLGSVFGTHVPPLQWLPVVQPPVHVPDVQLLHASQLVLQQ
jgi:hypothetical protein